MVTGRSVSRTIRDWVVVRRHRRIEDRQHPQTSTLATHSYDHPDVPTPQPVRFCQRLQLPARQLGLQHNIPGWWVPGLLGNIQQPRTVVQPKRNSQFRLRALERRASIFPELYSTLGRLSNLGSATSSIPACANSKFQRSGGEHH